MLRKTATLLGLAALVTTRVAFADVGGAERSGIGQERAAREHSTSERSSREHSAPEHTSHEHSPAELTFGNVKGVFDSANEKAAPPNKAGHKTAAANRSEAPSNATGPGGNSTAAKLEKKAEQTAEKAAVTQALKQGAKVTARAVAG